MVGMRKMLLITKNASALTIAEKRRILKTLGLKNQKELIQYVQDSGGSLPTNAKARKTKAFTFGKMIYNADVKQRNKKIVIAQREKKNMNQYIYRFNKNLKTLITDEKKFKIRKPNINQFRRILTRFSQQVMPNVLMKVGDVKYALNNKTIDRLLSNIDDLFYEEIDADSGDSDKQLIYAIREYKKVEFERLAMTSIYKKGKGGFFKYLHKMKFDLSEFQIYDELNAENYKGDDCFIHALVVAGVNDQIITDIRLMVKTCEMPMHLIKKIALKHDLYISVSYPDKKEKTRRVNYGKKENQCIELGLIGEHYFLNKKIKMTTHALENFEKEEWLYKIEDGKKKKTNKPADHVTSYTAIRTMFNEQQKYLTPITKCHEIYKTKYHGKFTKIESLEYTEDNYRKTFSNKFGIDFDDDEYANSFNDLFGDSDIDDDDGNKDVYENCYFDFETTTDSEKHKPFLCRVRGVDIDFMKKKNYKTGKYYGEYDDNIGLRMLRFLVKKHGGKNLKLLAHNATYDLRFIFDYIQFDNIIERGSKMMRYSGKFWYEKGKYVKIIIQDTYSLITMPLRDFGETFGLTCEKEIMPYSLYNHKMMTKASTISDGVTKQRCKKHCAIDDVSYDDFIVNCEKWGCVKPTGKIDIMRYSSKYCEMDCEVLGAGYEKFTEWIYEITGLNVDDYVSIASLVNDYMIKEGVFTGVYQLSGVVREFIQKCMVGGRVMLRNNEKQRTTQRLNDYDKVSLYPAAMWELLGYLKGLPKVLKAEECNQEFLNKQDGYFVEARILKVRKNYAFPLMSKKEENGNRNFTNEMEGEIMHLDKISLEDIENFHKADVEIIRGYYYNEGRNEKLKTVIEHLFNERVKAKANGNKIQIVYKLMMNASYGKTLLKPIEDQIFIKTQKELNVFINRNYQNIKTIVPLNTKETQTDYDKSKIKVIKSVDEHFNNCHCGVEILAMSKRIMNRVMCLADDFKIKILYQDTDSMHLPDKDVKPLEKLFKARYGYGLTGKGLKHFHCDFDSKKLKGDLTSVESVFLMKKCYIDKLEGINKETGKIDHDYHIRMKGMNKRGVEHRADESFKGDVMAVYDAMYYGVKLPFDMCGGGKKSQFEFKSNMTITSKKAFIRVM